MPPKFKSDIFIGAEFVNRLGEKVHIVEMPQNKKVKIEWQGGYQTLTRTHQLRQGSFKNPFTPSVYGVGYLGIGDYEPSNEGGRTVQYDAWASMLQRCYDVKVHEQFPTYAGVTVCEEWKCFQTFAEWYTENMPKTSVDIWHLDKDLKRSKRYSPNTCVIVPQEINVALVKGQARRNGLPIGVSYEICKGKYRARCQNGTGKAVHLGYFQTPENAFIAYKIFKENWLKSLAEKYKKDLTKEAYQAILSYVVLIDD